MSLKVTTVLEKTLDEMLLQSFDLMKKTMDCYFCLSTGGTVHKKKLDALKLHIDKLKDLEANLP
jgi:hypothetical protein